METNVSAGLLIDWVKLLHLSENITKLKVFSLERYGLFVQSFSAKDVPFSEILKKRLIWIYKTDPRGLCRVTVRKKLILARELDLKTSFDEVYQFNSEHLREGSAMIS
jgi:aspartokinase/homoserine dehydrogenase 1